MQMHHLTLNRAFVFALLPLLSVWDVMWWDASLSIQISLAPSPYHPTLFCLNPVILEPPGKQQLEAHAITSIVSRIDLSHLPHPQKELMEDVSHTIRQSISTNSTNSSTWREIERKKSKIEATKVIYSREGKKTEVKRRQPAINQCLNNWMIVFLSSYLVSSGTNTPSHERASINSEPRSSRMVKVTASSSSRRQQFQIWKFIKYV